MSIPSFDPLMFLAIIPEIGTVVLGLLVLLLALIWKGEQRRQLAWVTAGGLAIVCILTAAFARPLDQNYLIFGGVIRWDWMSWSMTVVFFFAGAITAMLVKDLDNLGNEVEFYFLMLTSILGMCLMVASADLIMLFLAIETTSIPLYILAGFFKRDEASTEAGFKYLLFGAATSAVMLYGFSLLFGMTGTTQLYVMQSNLTKMQVPGVLGFMILFLILVGLCFKVAVVPFHFWAPDVYQGAPTPVAGFLSTASKAAGFIVMLRVLTVVFPDYRSVWSIIISVLSAASMLFGNLQAMRQHNIKRLLAYSSIAQAGYMLIGVASISILGFSSVVIYLVAYMVTNLAAFGIIAIIGNVVKSDEISAYTGLARRSPGLALGLLAAFLSLAGIPPFAGFVGKVLLFSSAMINMKVPWLIALAIIGILNSILALYYYLNVLRIVYQGDAETEPAPIAMGSSMKISVVLCVAGILAVGIAFSPVYNWAVNAAQSIFQ
jgi:NADH-quinone oxidoreductase subunit N